LKGKHSKEDIERDLDEKLKKVDPFYSDAQTMLEIHPMQVTLLSPGTFDRFYNVRQEAGLELGQRKPPRMNATDEDIKELVSLGEQING